MKSCKLEPALWPKNRNKLIVNQLLIWGSGVLVGVLVSLLRRPPRSMVDVVSWLLAIGVFLLAYGSAAVLFTVIKIKRARKRYESFELCMTDDVISRRQFQMPEINIRRDEVTRVQEVQGKGFMVRTADPVNLLWIPDELIGYDEVTKVLMRWGPAEAPRSSVPLMFNAQAGVTISAVGMLLMFLMRDAMIVTLVAVPYVGFMLYAALYAMRSPNRSDSGLKIVSTTAVATIFIVMRVITLWK